MIKLEQNIKDRIFEVFQSLTSRLTNSQVMAILAILVGLCAGLGAFIFNTLLHTITELLTSWTPDDQAQWLYLVYPGIGIILATLFVKYIVKDGIWRVLHVCSTQCHVAAHASRDITPGPRLWVVLRPSVLVVL